MTDTPRPRDLGAPSSGPDALEVVGRHAVIVGVGGFHAPLVPPLPCAEADALALRDALADPGCGGFAPEDVRALIGEQATRTEVMKALEGALRRRVGEQDLVVVSFATHGIVDDTGDGYLLLADSDPDAPLSTALRMADLASWLSRLPSRHVVVIVDACHAGGTTPSTEWAQSLRSFGEDPRGGRVVLAACRAGERSHEVERDGHGIFTRHLLAGLQGEADMNRDGVVDPVELFHYVQEHVRQQAEELGVTQTPTWWGALSSDVALGRDPLATTGPIPASIRRRVRARLVLVDELGPRARFRLEGRRVTIGRHPDCDIQLLGDGCVSRNHATLERSGGVWRITTAVPQRTLRNGEQVTGATELAQGDVLRLGETELTFYAGDDAPSDVKLVAPPPRSPLADMTVDEVLAELQLDEDEFKRLVSRRLLRGFRAGSQMKFKRTDVAALKSGLTDERITPDLDEAVFASGPDEHVLFDPDVALAYEATDEADTGLEASDEVGGRSTITDPRRRPGAEQRSTPPHGVAPSSHMPEGPHGLLLSRIADPQKRAQAAQLIAEITGCTLDDARRLTDRVIIPVLKGVSREVAERHRETFMRAAIVARVTTRQG